MSFCTEWCVSQSIWLTRVAKSKVNYLVNILLGFQLLPILFLIIFLILLLMLCKHLHIWLRLNNILPETYTWHHSIKTCYLIERKSSEEESHFLKTYVEMWQPRMIDKNYSAFTVWRHGEKCLWVDFMKSTESKHSCVC